MNELPRDQYRHVNLPEAKTDPYGHLEYCIGTGDDFYCFDFAIFQHEGRSYCALHSTINSTTGSFIQDGDYRVLELKVYEEGEALSAAAEMVSEALDWCVMGGDTPLRHHKTGWNQDPYYFVRSLARSLYRHGVESEGIAALSRRARWFRFGSKTLNRQIENLSPSLRGILPVTQPPRREHSTP